MDQREEEVDHGAARIVAHDLLGVTPKRAIVAFTFDGDAVEGRDGEPIAAALLAAGYRVLRTMPRIGDARGGYCMVGRCADCLVTVEGVPNVAACMTPIVAGMDVRTQFGLGEAQLTTPEVPHV